MIEDNQDIGRWKIKNSIKKLKNYRSNTATGLITLILPPKTQIPIVQSMLQNELGTATSIKSHTNKLSVLTAIVSTQQKLKQYKTVPENGLIIFCGTITTDGKEKKVTIDIEPFKPIGRYWYRCDNKFHVDILEDLLLDDREYGFILICGECTLFGKVQGNTKTIITKLTVDLPKKHKKGGQSSMRFCRIRMEKRDAYLKKVCELTTQVFITNNMPNISGIFVAGIAEFKNQLVILDTFDNRLKPLIIKVIDISYCGEQGFSQAIEFVKPDLGNIGLIREKSIIDEFFMEIKNDTGKTVYGENETFQALVACVIDKLILYENLDYYYTESGLVKSTGNEELLFTEWITENYKTYNCTIHFVSINTSEGMQFVKGFKGICAILKYPWQPEINQNTNQDTNQDTNQETNQETNQIKEHTNLQDLNEDDFFM